MRSFGYWLGSATRWIRLLVGFRLLVGVVVVLVVLDIGADQCPEFFARFEVGDFFCWNGDRKAGFRVAADTGVALAGAKAAEAAHFYLVAGFEGADDGFKERFHDDFTVTAGEVIESGDAVGEVGLGHGGSISGRASFHGPSVREAGGLHGAG